VPTTAVIDQLALSLLHHNHPTLVRVSYTSAPRLVGQRDALGKSFDVLMAVNNPTPFRHKILNGSMLMRGRSAKQSRSVFVPVLSAGDRAVFGSVAS